MGLIPLDKITDSIKGAGDSAVEFIKKCKDSIPFEVYFLHATTESELLNAEAVIRAVPEGKYISEDAAASNLILTANARHYLNINTREDKWIDPSVAGIAPTTQLTHLDRLSQRPRIVIRFIKPLPAPREVEVEIFDPNAGTPTANLSYNSAALATNAAAATAEVDRCDKFKENLKSKFSVDVSGVLVIDELTAAPATLFISAMGGNKYKVRGKDLATGFWSKNFGNPLGTIETWRYFWLLHMIHSTLSSGIDCAGLASQYETSFCTLNLTRYPAVRDARIDVDDADLSGIGLTAASQLLSALRDIYNASGIRNMEPYAMAFASIRICVESLDPANFKDNFPSGQAVYEHQLCPPMYSPDNFATQANWLTSATFTPDGVGTTPVNISTACRVLTDPDFRLASTVQVERNSFPPHIRNASGEVEINVSSTISVATNGWSWYNLCVVRMDNACNPGDVQIPTSPRVKTLPVPGGASGDAGPSSTAFHEAGHFMNLVSDGSISNGTTTLGGKPDNTGNHYALNGPHCNPPGVVGPPPSSTVPTCVMFGVGKGNRPDNLCSTCSAALRKMDLSLGRASFAPHL